MHLLLDYVIQVLLLHHIYQEHSGDGHVLALMEEVQLAVSLTRQLIQSTEDVDLLMEEHILLLLPGDYAQLEQLLQ